MIASDDGAHIACVEPARIALYGLPGLRPASEITIDGGEEHNDAVFCGEHLIVLTRSVTTNLYVIALRGPRGPRKLEQVALRGPARIVAAAGRHVLVTTSYSTVLISLDPLEMAAMPVRGPVIAASRLGNDRFIIATEGLLEEWDATHRAPSRRLRLERRFDPLFVGGNSLRFWMIRRSEPDQIDVISLTRNIARRYALPEPVQAVSVHTRGDLLAAIGARSGMPFVIDLAQPEPVSRPVPYCVNTLAWAGRGRSLALAPVAGGLALHRVPGCTESDVQTTPIPVPVEPPPEDDDDVSARLSAWRARQQRTGFAGQR